MSDKISNHKKLAMGKEAKTSCSPLKKMKAGGAVKHSDEAQDKKLIKKMIAASEKKEAGYKKGGSVKSKKC